MNSLIFWHSAVDEDVSKNEIPIILVSDQNPDTAGTCAVFWLPPMANLSTLSSSQNLQTLPLSPSNTSMFAFEDPRWFPFRHVSDTLAKILLERILITSEALNPNRKKLPLLRFCLDSHIPPFTHPLRVCSPLPHTFSLNQGGVRFSSFDPATPPSDHRPHEDPLWQP